MWITLGFWMPIITLFYKHLGTANEEQQWANYTLIATPSKGVMCGANLLIHPHS